MGEKKETQVGRQRRLRAALRKNLKRRKAQARGRQSRGERPAKHDSSPKSNDSQG
jgi:hypothetical protein